MSPAVYSQGGRRRRPICPTFLHANHGRRVLVEVRDAGKVAAAQIPSLCKATGITTPQAGIVFRGMWDFKGLAQQQKNAAFHISISCLRNVYK